MMKNILVTGWVALVCGVIGAMGFAYFFGPKSKGSSSEGSQGESDSGSKKESGPKEKAGGGESKESGKESNAQAWTPELDPRRLGGQSRISQCNRSRTCRSGSTSCASGWTV